jgi:hypothetical protein
MRPSRSDACNLNLCENLLTHVAGVKWWKSGKTTAEIAFRGWRPVYKFVLGKTCPDREQSQGGVGVGCVFLPPEQRQTHLGDEDVPQFMGEQDERVSRHELHPVDPLLFCEAFETRTVQGGFRGGLDPSRLSRLSLLCHRRNGAEKKDPERGPPNPKTDVSHVHRHFVRIRQPYGLGFHSRASASCDAYPILLLNRERSSTVRNEPPTRMLAPIRPPTVSSAEAIVWRGPPLQHRAKPAALPSP